MTAASFVATGIRSLPGARRVESVAAVAGSIGHGADNSIGDQAAGIAEAGRVKGPGGGTLDCFVGHAGDGWCRGIDHRHFLATTGFVAAGICGLPRARRVESVAAVTGSVGHGADNSVCD